MKELLFSISLAFIAFTNNAQVIPWENYPTYDGSDLGLTYSKEFSQFKIYAPTAQQAEVILYTHGFEDSEAYRYPLVKSQQGTWEIKISNDLKGKFYAFRVLINNHWSEEVPDPYVKCVGVNGKRGMIVDLKETNPENWQLDTSPPFKNSVDAIIYELHVRDASIHRSSGITNKGKFLGLTETRAKNSGGLSTGIDHIKELGVTHVHLLPSYDFNSIDEAITNSSKYNWGYDPLNYNVPEGSYATDPTDGSIRILEFKKLIQTFHREGLRIVMDVVYNHTALTQNSYFNILVPGYYYRQHADGSFSNGSACGNETASDHPMMRKFMIESLVYWVNEYHVDGFRFDLMGIHDIETMNLIADTLRKIKPDILLYGEGWTAGNVQIKEEQQAIKKNATKLNKIAVFSDDIRDGIKGSVFDHEEQGFASGLINQSESIKFGIVAACNHPQIDYNKVKYSKAAFANNPASTIAYASCHDNHTLWDKLRISRPDASEAQRKEMHKLALSIVLTAQGIPFLHGGTEMLRSKKGIENSFESPDSINAIDWDLKTANKNVFDYVKHLINLRKAHPAFRLKTEQEIQTLIKFQPNLPEGTVGFIIDGGKIGDLWKNILVLFNGAANQQEIKLPKGAWHLSVHNNQESEGKITRFVPLAPSSCTILFQLN